jgi:hypothetical protein
MKDLFSQYGPLVLGCISAVLIISIFFFVIHEPVTEMIKSWIALIF